MYTNNLVFVDNQILSFDADRLYYLTSLEDTNFIYLFAHFELVGQTFVKIQKRAIGIVSVGIILSSQRFCVYTVGEYINNIYCCFCFC